MWHRHAAVLPNDRRQREPVDVVDLSRLERAAGIDNLVAGRENRDARTRVDIDVREAERGNRADAARIEHLAGAHDGLAALDVRALAPDVLSGISSRKDLNLRGVGAGL